MFGVSAVCVSSRAYGLRRSITAHDVRLSPETEASLQKGNYRHVTAFPVVRVKANAGKK